MKDVDLTSYRGWLEPLGLIGMESIEAPLLAALVTEQPLLLIGPHGTAKSLLLGRVAAALELSFRHYNASLLNFDDLVGFPVPTPDRTLEYLKTPAAIWGAGAVIFDEISRCRPDVRNKLFPIIHERKVQGLDIEGLRYRWAAMNPPTVGADEGEYAGSELLDRALADRFAFVVQMPSWAGFTPSQKLAVIQAGNRSYGPQDARALNDCLHLARGFRWQRLLYDGTYATIEDLAAAEKINPSYVSRILRLAYLSPKVVQAILDGSHPAWLTMRDLLEPFPMDWQLQEKKFLARFEESNPTSEY
jgi:MoxR-like ATPase